MLITNTILLALYATLSASAPVFNSDRMQVERHTDKSIYWYIPAHNPKITNSEHPGFRGILQTVEILEEADKAMKAVATATKATATTEDTARPHVRRNNNAQGGSGKISPLKAAAMAVGIDPKSISEYLASLRDDFLIQVQDRLPACLNAATRQGLSAIEASLSGIPKCLSDNDDEIEISTDGVEVDADGLPKCLDKAGQDALRSIQDALNNLGDCAAATPSASAQG